MNPKLYFIGTDASGQQIDTKHGLVNIACSTFVVIDAETNERKDVYSYFLIDENVNFAEAFAINMALHYFTNPAVSENRGAIIFSDSVFALNQTLDYISQFHTGMKRPKGFKMMNGFKHVCYNNALLAYTSLFPVQFRYQPGHPEKMNYNYKLISDKADHENYKLGLKEDRENLASTIRQPIYANQLTDRISNCELQNKIKTIRQIVNDYEIIPDRKNRHFPLRLYANEIQALIPICYRVDVLDVLGIRPEVLPTHYEIKNNPIKEGVKLNGNPL